MSNDSKSITLKASGFFSVIFAVVVFLNTRKCVENTAVPHLPSFHMSHSIQWWRGMLISFISKLLLFMELAYSVACECYYMWMCDGPFDLCKRRPSLS